MVSHSHEVQVRLKTCDIDCPEEVARHGLLGTLQYTRDA